MRVAIVGAGALGCLFAARLSPIADTLLLTRRASQAQEIAQSGIRIELDGETQAVPVQAAATAAGLEAADVVLILTKAYDTAGACVSAASLVGRETIVVTLQNGLGNDEAIAAAFGADRTVRGTTTEAATLLGTGWVRHAARGRTTLECRGPHSGRIAVFGRLLEAAGFATSLVEDAGPGIWQKVAINAAINGPTGLLGVRNGWIAESEAAQTLARAIVDEVSAVAARSGIPVDDGWGEAAIEVARVTGQNISSMLQDLRAGRRTEADAIYGEIVRRAHQLDLRAPHCETVALLLQAWSDSHPSGTERPNNEAG